MESLHEVMTYGERETALAPPFPRCLHLFSLGTVREKVLEVTEP